jgi:hypothetical protein
VQSLQTERWAGKCRSRRRKGGVGLVVLVSQYKKRKRTPGLEGPGVNEVSFRSRPHHRVYRTLGVDARATGPRWRVDSMVSHYICALQIKFSLQYLYQSIFGSPIPL